MPKNTRKSVSKQKKKRNRALSSKKKAKRKTKPVTKKKTMSCTGSSGHPPVQSCYRKKKSRVLVTCTKEGSRLQFRALPGQGYCPALTIQFPRAMGKEGATYMVGNLVLSQKVNKQYFYLAKAPIQQLTHICEKTSCPRTKC
jgi:hypothetical protein